MLYQIKILTTVIEIDLDINLEPYSDCLSISICPSMYTIDATISNLYNRLDHKHQNKYFDFAAYCSMRFHEAIIYGLKYAYKIYTKETKKIGCVIIVHKFKYSIGSSHGKVAIAASRAVWNFLQFTPINDIGYIEEKDIYVFPHADTPPPYGEMTPLEFKRGELKLSENKYSIFCEYYLKEQLIHFSSMPVFI